MPHTHSSNFYFAILLKQNFRLNRGSNLRTVCLCVLAVHLEVATCFQQVYSCEVKRDNYFSRRNKMRHKRNWRQWDRIRWKNVACEIKIAAVRQWQINKAGGGTTETRKCAKGWEERVRVKERKQEKKDNKKKYGAQKKWRGGEERDRRRMQCKGKRSQWREVKWNRAGGHSFCVCVESIVERNMCFWASGAMFSCHNHSWGAPCVLICVCCAWQDWNRQAGQMFKNLLAAGMRVCVCRHTSCVHLSLLVIIYSHSN